MSEVGGLAGITCTDGIRHADMQRSMLSTTAAPKISLPSAYREPHTRLSVTDYLTDVLYDQGGTKEFDMDKQAIAAEEATVRFMAKEREGRLTLIERALGVQSGIHLAFVFDGNGEEFAFSDKDAELASRISGLPLSGRLPLAFVEGDLRGADLALALFCPVVVLSPKALLGSGFGRPGSPAVYVAAARRIGQVACERLLFNHVATTAAAASEANLATLAENLAEAIQANAARSSTMLSVARANLVTWPVTYSGLLAVADLAN